MTGDLSGQTVKGYDIDERIGLGSFGAVYRAIQSSVGREVAIKIILPDYANQPDFVRRFESEARLVARLEHPHIVPLFDYWREPDRAYLVMRLLPNNLRTRINLDGIIAPAEAVQIVEQIASALAMSHRQGIVHRDIKPDNILLDDQGNAYLTDFGLAEVIHSNLPLDDNHGVTGSPAYMSPEQLKGEPVTHQSDIYALGIVIYEMLTGTHPFGDRASISELIHKHLLQTVPPTYDANPHLPEALDYVIQRATHKDTSERYDDVLDLASDLHSALLGEHFFAPGPLATRDIANPYKGLRAFEEVDASHFFGREMLVSTLIDRLCDDHPLARFVAVVGPSGSGKSSLIHAGVVPALRHGALPGSERWLVTNIVPSIRPLTELENALLRVAIKPVEDLQNRLYTDPRGLVTTVEHIVAGTDDDLVLVVDQFEELFTVTQDEAERVQFLTLLQTAVTDPDSRLRIVINLRADFYDRPLLYEAFGALMQARTTIVLPLSESELERAIVAPAEQVGVHVEPNLTTAIIADVRAEPGALPLMQYALTEVFERREGRTMTHEGYEGIGRAAGALARQAETVYRQLNDQQQALTQQLFLRLVNLVEGSENVRRRANRAELFSAVDDPGQLETVLNIFGRHRLLSFDHDPSTREPTVEVAHEALLRAWQRLGAWLDDSREDVRQQRRLAALADEWLRAQSDPSFLLRGVQLETIEYWLSGTMIALTDTERDFINASIAVREQQRNEELARRAHEAALEQRTRRFQWYLVGVMFLAMVVAIILSFLAIQQRQQAHSARRDAEDNAQIAQTQAASAATAAAIAEQRANELQSLALVADAERTLDDQDYDLALALAVEANRIPAAPVDAQQLLADIALMTASYVYRGHTDSVNTVALSPDGSRMISGGDDGTLIVWDMATHQPLKTWTAHRSRVRSVVFLPDSQHALSGGDDALIVLWDTTTGEAIRTYTGHGNDIFAIAVHPNGTQFVAGSRDRALILWDIETGQIVRRFGSDTQGHTQRITSVAFAPDGSQIVSGSADNTLILWDTATGALITQMSGHTDSISDVAFSPDGTRILSASADTTLILWDAHTHSMITRLQGHSERVSSVAFSPDGLKAISGAGNQFAGATGDNSLILWNLFLEQPEQRYQGHQMYVSDVTFSADGHMILSASADGTVRQWPAEYDIELAHHEDAAATYNAVTFDAAHYQAWIAYGDHTIAAQSVNLDGTSEELFRFPASAQTGTITAIAVSPDGSRLLTAATDRTIVLWDTASGEALHTMTGHTQTISALVFSQDGTRALSGSADRTLILWDLTSGEAIRTFETRHTHPIEAVALSPDGTHALSGARDSTMILWDVATGTALTTFKGHTDGIHAVAFSPDGSHALSGSRDKTVILWDLITGETLRHFGAAGEGHTDWVTTVTFSPDSTLVLSASRDRTIILWDIASGNILRRDAGHIGNPIAAQFSPDSEYAFAAYDNGGLRLFPAERASLLEWTLNNRDIRPLTCEELTYYRLGDCEDDTLDMNRGMSITPIPQ